MQPRFLNEAEVLQLHQRSIDRYGGASGVASPGLLESALAAPCQQFGGQYLHETLCDQAAAYLYHLVQNHPFMDGNKRIGAIAAFVFRQLNGFDLVAPEDDFESLVMDVAQGKTGKTEVSVFLSKFLVPVHPNRSQQ